MEPTGADQSRWLGLRACDATDPRCGCQAGERVGGHAGWCAQRGDQQAAQRGTDDIDGPEAGLVPTVRMHPERRGTSAFRWAPEAAVKQMVPVAATTATRQSWVKLSSPKWTDTGTLIRASARHVGQHHHGTLAAALDQRACW